jgi:uncharacterized protein involved in propanediol utilization
MMHVVRQSELNRVPGARIVPGDADLPYELRLEANPAKPARYPRRCSIGMGFAPATFGELIQGREPVRGRDFLVTLPITAGSTAVFYGFENSSQLYVLPHHKKKSALAARLLLDALGVKSGGILQIRSELSEGKGLASSSADVVATLRAVADYYEVPLTNGQMCELIRRIEPTDGVMYDQSVAFFHREVTLDRVIGNLPRMCILAADEGGTIDTVAYNERRFEFENEELATYGQLLVQVLEAVERNDVAAIGAAATTSTRLHQKRNPKRLLEQFEAVALKTGASGIVNCHSGTHLGLCFDACGVDALDRVAKAGAELERVLNRRVQRFFTR